MPRRGGRLKPAKTRLQEFQRAERQGHPRIISEGDSWFAIPIRKNLIDHLLKKGKYAILRLESNGDEAVQMMREKHKKALRRNLKNIDFRVLLFSEGGNDIVGDNLTDLIEEKTKIKRRDHLVRREILEARLSTMRGAYQELIATRNIYRPNCHGIAHGYDYPIRLGKGVDPVGLWILPNLLDKGIVDEEDQIFITKKLIDTFNYLLKKFARNTPKFEWVDFRGMLPNVKDWGDELHPTTKGFEKLRVKLKRVVDTVLKS